MYFIFTLTYIVVARADLHLPTTKIDNDNDDKCNDKQRDGQMSSVSVDADVVIVNHAVARADLHLSTAIINNNNDDKCNDKQRDGQTTSVNAEADVVIVNHAVAVEQKIVPN